LAEESDIFDIVIVGAGSSGSVFAGRLAERGDLSIAVIEAGRRHWPNVNAIPAAVFRSIGHPNYDWQYVSQPDPTRQGRYEGWPRGKGPGGSSLINGTIYVRGNPADYDHWARLGAQGWDYKSVLPYFRSVETTSIESQFRGAFGPLPIDLPPYKFGMSDLVIQAAEAMGLGANADYNGASQQGFGLVQANQRRGRRVTPFDAFLAPHLGRARIDLIEGALTQRVLFEDKKAIGVVVTQGATQRQILARHKVVLCAGTINTPQILMLSGIGPSDHLARHGIPLIADRAEVGHNLREHAAVLMPVQVNCPTVNQFSSKIAMFGAAVKWLFAAGPAAAATAQVVGFHHIDDPYGRSDLQFHFAPFSFETSEKGVVAMPNKPLIMLAPSLNHPRSSGVVELTGNDVRLPPSIRPLMLGDPRDVQTLAKGIRIVERLLATEPLAKNIVGLVDPPPADAADLEDYIRAKAAPIYHPVGTCRMGSDATSVVTPDLHVQGVENLMIVDASVLPAHVSGNTHAVSIMIGEKAAKEMKST
jgi:choline dehydrogenase